MSSVDGGVVALGSTFAITASGAIWKLASLRSDIVANYGGRLSLAEAGIDEKAATALKRLAEQVNQVLGDLETFDPHQVIGDPNELESALDVVDRLLAARRHLRRCLNGMLKVGPALVGVLLLFVPSDLVALSYFSGWTRGRFVGYVGLWSSFGFLALAVAIAIYHIYLLHRFSGAEVLALPDGTRA